MSENGQKKKSVAFEGPVGVDDVVIYLQALQTALEKGTVYVQNGTEVVGLEPEGEMTMEVEARVKREKQSIKFSLKWEKVELPEEQSVESFAISDTEPEIPDLVIEEVE